MKKLIVTVISFLVMCLATATAQVNWQKSLGPKESNISYLTHSDGIWWMLGYDGQYSTDDGLSWKTLPGSESIYDMDSYSSIVTPYMPEIDVSGSTAFVYFEQFGGGSTELFCNHGSDSSWTSVPFVPRRANGESLVQYGDTVLVIATVGNQHRLAYSSDGGDHWVLKSDQNGWGYANTIHRAQGKLFMVNFEGELWTSEDEADTWTRIYKASATLPYSIGRDPLFIGQGILCRSSDPSKFVVSPDGGQSWQVVNAPGTNFFNGHSLCADGNTIYNSHDGSAFFTTQDLGQTWTPLAMTGLPIQGTWYAGAWKVVSGTMLMLDYTNKQLYRSTDGGHSFLKVPKPPIAPLVYTFAHSGDTWFTCTDKGLYRSTDAGINWTAQNLGLSAIVAASGNNVIAIGYQTFAYSNNKGQTWNSNGGDAEQVAATNSALYYTHLDKVYRKPSAGIFNQLNVPTTGLGVNYFRVMAVNGGNILLGASNSHVFRSTNSGASWQVISDTTFAGKALVGGGLFFGKEYIAANRDLYRRKADGAWEKLWEIPASIESDPIYINLHLQQRGDKLLAFLFGAGAYISPDSGATWVNYPYLPGSNRLSSAFADTSLTVLSMRGGLYSSRDLFDVAFYGGKVFFDNNLNGIRDTDDFPMPQIIVSNENGDEVSATNVGGHYRFLFDGPDSINVEGLCKYCISVPAGYKITAPGDTFDFAVQVPAGITDLGINLTNVEPVRPGFEADFVAYIQNVGTDTMASTVQLTLPSYFSFVSAVPLPDMISGNTVTWNVAALAPNTASSIKLRLKLSNSQPITSDIYAVATVISALPDVDLANNTDTLHMTVVGAFDPNDKAVTPLGDIDVDALQDSLVLTYTIRFQNTGNYPAEVVRVVDTLPVGVDVRSFRLLANSHPVTWTLVDNRVVTFRFDNIFLPDSLQNEMDSHGFVRFSVKTKLELGIGDSIANRAAIYFDFNEPVITNAAVNEIIQVVAAKTPSQASLDFEIVPTLASTSITLMNKSTEGAQVMIVSALGNVVQVLTMEAGSSRRVDVGNWPGGGYFAKVVFRSGRLGVIGLVKMK